VPAEVAYFEWYLPPITLTQYLRFHRYSLDAYQSGLIWQIICYKIQIMAHLNTLTSEVRIFCCIPGFSIRSLSHYGNNRKQFRHYGKQNVTVLSTFQSAFQKIR